MAEDDISIHINKEHLSADLELTHMKIQEKIEELNNFKESDTSREELLE